MTVTDPLEKQMSDAQKDKQLKNLKVENTILCVAVFILFVIVLTLFTVQGNKDSAVEASPEVEYSMIDDEPEPDTADSLQVETIDNDSYTRFVAAIINESNTNLEAETCYIIANEIIWWMLFWEIPDSEMPYLLALYMQESAFDPDAKNPTSTASGIGQLLRFHWKDRGDPWDIEFNLLVSFELIGPKWNKYGNWFDVFREYCGNGTNAGNVFDRLEREQYEMKLEAWGG